MSLAAVLWLFKIALVNELTTTIGLISATLFMATLAWALKFHTLIAKE